MGTRVFSQPRAARNRRAQSLQLAATIRARRLQLKLSLEDAAELSGLEPDQWQALEAGWIPPLDQNVWYSLAGTLQIKVARLWNLVSVDLAREEVLAQAEKVA